MMGGINMGLIQRAVKKTMTKNAKAMMDELKIWLEKHGFQVIKYEPPLIDYDFLPIHPVVYETIGHVPKSMVEVTVDERKLLDIELKKICDPIVQEIKIGKIYSEVGKKRKSVND
jgi:hypothetical protein